MGLNSFNYSTGDKKLGESDEWRKMICDAAYFIAQKRNFTPGSEIKDWLAAEAQVASGLAQRNLGNLR